MFVTNGQPLQGVVAVAVTTGEIDGGGFVLIVYRMGAAEAS